MYIERWHESGNEDEMERLIKTGVVLLVAAMIGCGGTARRGGLYEIYDQAKHTGFEAGPIIEVAVDTCGPVRVELIEDTGTPVGRLLDTVLCAGVHTFACRRAMRISGRGEAAETTLVMLDTLSREVYFYKVFTSKATKIETIMKK